ADGACRKARVLSQDGKVDRETFGEVRRLSRAAIQLTNNPGWYLAWSLGQRGLAFGLAGS
ncbi:MAG: hypothetical protein AAFV77_11370, partial [Planctomycetota bacterium]